MAVVIAESIVMARRLTSRLACGVALLALSSGAVVTGAGPDARPSQSRSRVSASRAGATSPRGPSR